ncbi:MAG: type 4a pilus biogenesis protein PilO [bacterium]|nr:type 4a pilus biogenesis protein PilO [bacterium]
MTFTTKSSIFILISILFFIAVLGMALGLVWPALIDLSQLKQERVNKAEERTVKQNMVERITALTSQHQGLSTDVLTKVNRAAPKGQNIPDLLVQMENTAAESNLVLESADFTALAPRTGETQSSRMLMANLTLKGDYPAFRQWLKFWESNLRLIDVRSIDFNLSSTERSIFTLKIRFLVYYQ